MSNKNNNQQRRVTKSRRRNQSARGETKSSSRQNVPAAFNKRNFNAKPRIRSGPKSTTIAHKEFLGNLVESRLYGVNSYPINPGMSQTFPWLSQQATSWEQYRFKRLRFTFVTRVGTTSLGSVIMALDYDPLDLPPATEEDITQFDGAVEDAVWARDMSVRADIKDMFAVGPRKYIRSGAAMNLRTSDAGIFHVATVGCATDVNVIGKVWVEYEVEFFIPQKHQARALNLYYTGTNGTQILPGMALYPTTFVPGGATEQVEQKGLGIELYDHETFFVPQGCYRIDYNAMVQSIAPTDYNITNRWYWSDTPGGTYTAATGSVETKSRYTGTGVTERQEAINNTDIIDVVEKGGKYMKLMNDVLANSATALQILDSAVTWVSALL
jgi:hypothetical protein